MQSFIRSCLTHSALLGVLVGTTVAGFCGVGSAIAIQPKNAAPAAVKSNHWAFQSLNSLIERYGCVIVSSSNVPFQAINAPTRYEMAAALNECLDKIADRFKTTEDRISAQALQKEFKREIDILQPSIGSLAAWTATLESQQFSTINHPVGEVAYFSPFPGLLLQPTHWSFQAVQSLIERYQCILNAPDTPNRNSSATSRYEMAALISTCLNRIGDRFANQKDLETAQALQKEFKRETEIFKKNEDILSIPTLPPLKAEQFSPSTKLGGPVVSPVKSSPDLKKVEDRTATLESQQFSTTTKIQGEAVVTFQGGGFR
jgi:hypothetical protein